MYRTFISACIIVGGFVQASHAALVCVARVGVVDGVSDEALREAFAIERRKVDRPEAVAPTLVEVAALDACPPETTLVATLGADGLRAGDKLLEGAALAAIDPLDRPSEVARVLIGWALAAGPDGDPLLDPHRRVAPPGGVEPRTWRVAFDVGPTWRNTFQAASDRGAVEGSLGVAGWDERVLVALEGGWEWPREEVARGVTTTTSAGALLLTVRGGGHVGPFLLRAGIAGGVEWRAIEATVPTRTEPGRAQSSAAIVAAELEGTICVTDALRLGLVAQGRWFLGGENYDWLGTRAWTAPDGALSLGLRFGISL